MRVFVLGTGRCCSTTFSKACIMQKYSVSHETNTFDTNVLYYYPDNHIESDPRLFWKLPQIISNYPDALYVHLIRENKACIESLSKRASLDHFAKFIDVVTIMSRRQLAERFYVFVNEMIEAYCLYKKVDYLKMNTPPTKEEWGSFLNKVESFHTFEQSWNKWSRRYNAS